MPSKSKEQAKLMAAVAHNPEFAKKVGIPQKVGKEFNKADTKAVKEAPAMGMAQGHTHLNKEAMALVDGAIRATAEGKTAQERIAILQKYAAEHKVSYNVLYSEITKDTGDTYFSHDDYMKDKQFSESKKLIESYISNFKKIK